jgi:anaphase-promoting complex subunit 1
LYDILTAPEELTLWPEFHNGVAAGLRVNPPLQSSNDGASNLAGRGNRFQQADRKTMSGTVTRNWIVYNRTASGENSSFHAGVLLALGLQGHLEVLLRTDIVEYLTNGHQPTTIGLLVGLAASKIGTAEVNMSKTLCLHIPALLPPEHWDIVITPQVQTAALTGLGLLYCESGHRLMTEFLLAELGRRPSLDRDSGDCREAMSFSAAWALGMVLLGKGGGEVIEGVSSDVSGLGGLTDLCIEDRLQQHMDGGKRPPESHIFPGSSSSQGDGYTAYGRSSRVMEGDQLNTGVTSPGAAVALGLMYIRFVLYCLFHTVTAFNLYI